MFVHKKAVTRKNQLAYVQVEFLCATAFYWLFAVFSIQFSRSLSTKPDGCDAKVFFECHGRVLQVTGLWDQVDDRVEMPLCGPPIVSRVDLTGQAFAVKNHRGPWSLSGNYEQDGMLPPLLATDPGCESGILDGIPAAILGI